jgi:RES domain-containing protein
MATFWRISNHMDLGGWGGLKFSSRWTTLGKRIVYMAETPAGAMLETLVHFTDRDDGLPRTYTLIEIDAPDALPIQELLPLADTNWRKQMEATQRIGDAWLASLKTPLASVPSAIVPRTWNLLLNPLHSDAEKVRIVSVIRERFDNRLFLGGAR